MKKYIVKVMAEMTPHNPRYNLDVEDKVRVHYYGKGDAYGRCVEDFTGWKSQEGWSHKRWAEQYILNEIGWYTQWYENNKKRAEARGETYHEPFWQYSYDIIEYEAQ